MRLECPHCGGCLRKKRRSPEAHRMFFGVIAGAFRQWPETLDFQPEDSEHLRSWLLCNAGHRASVDVTKTDDPLEFATACAAVARMHKHIFPRIMGKTVRLYFPRSIAWHELDQTEFNRITDPVYEIIEVSIGVPVDMLERHKCAA